MPLGRQPEFVLEFPSWAINAQIVNNNMGDDS
jgi:hypothetical protein